MTTTADPTGDATPGYLDIVRMRPDASSGQLTLTLDLAAAVPTGSPQVGELAYIFWLDVDGDGAPHYAAALALLPGGGFAPSLVNIRTGVKLEGGAYPGTANLAGRSITLTLPLAKLGCPPTLHVRAASEQTKGGTKSGDTVPDVATDWIPVATGC